MTSVFAWLCLVLVLVGLGTVGGLVLSDWWHEQRRRSLKNQESKIEAEWSALRTAQRLNAAFLEARRAMWEEAVRQGGQPRHRQADDR